MLKVYSMIAAVGLALPVWAEGPALVTVTGNVSVPNRGPLDPGTDRFLAFHEIGFDKAAAFDFEGLDTLPQVTLRADFPKGGPEYTFSGPLLADVLGRAGADGETVTVQALDGYAVDAPLSELVAQGAVLALTRNGQPLGIGDFGPVWVVFPRAERADLADMTDDRWVWSVFHIHVE